MTRRVHTSRSTTRTALSCALASCLAFAAAPVFAQSTSATIRGQVLADSTPAADATVKATNVATGLTRTAQAQNASYNLAGLPPGTYRVDVTANGQSSSQTVTVLVGQTATLNLGVGGVAETAAPGEATDLDTVTVVAPPALIETKTSEIATYVTQQQIQALPQASRNFLAFADIVPGVTFTTGNDGSTSLRSGPQLSNGVNVFIDGVGQKDYVLKGGITGQDSSRGNPFPQLGIAEYKVVTSNYKAEYDQLSSAGISAVTRSGTNEFHGDFFWDKTTTDWREPTPAEEASGNKVKSREEQYGLSVGGPIIRDQLHFFVAYEAKDYNSPRTVTLGRDFQQADLPADIRSRVTGATSAPFQEDLYFGKIDWTPTDEQLIQLTVKRREEDEVTNIGGANAPEYATLKTGEETRIDLRHQFNAANWLNDAHLTFEDASFGPRPATLANGYRVFVPRQGQEANNNPDMDLVVNLGGGGDFQDKGQKGYSLQNDFTFFGWEGHTIKAGIKYKKIDISAFEQSPFTPQFEYDITRSTTVPYFVRFTAPGNGNPTTVESDVTQLGLYIQDDWDVTERLQLNLGIRWDYERNPSFEDHVTPETLVTRLRAYPNINNANVDYDIDDYISTGNNRESFKEAFAPRLGFSYDLSGDERHVIFGGAGRSYNRNQFDFLSFEQYRLAFQRYEFFFDTPGHDCDTAPVRSPCIPYDPSYQDPAVLAGLIVPGTNFGSEVFLINNELKTPYSDQFSLGIRNSFGLLGHDWNSSVTLLHVLSHDGILFSIGNRRPDGSYFPPGVNFGSSPGADLPGYGRFFLADNAVETRLNSVLVSLDKPYSRSSGWGTSFAYTYSDAKENRPASDNFTFDYPNLDDVAFFGARDIPKHKLVMTGIADWLGITFSGKFTWTSPPGNNGLNCFSRPDPGACSVGGRFETYYFDDQDFHQLDLAAQKEWNLGGDVRIRVRGDVLNVTNERNYSDFGNFKGVGGVVNDSFGERTGFGITGPTRTFKLTLGFSW